MSASDLAAGNTSLSSSSNTNTSSPQQSTLDTTSAIAQSTVAGDGLKCEWVGCGDRLTSPEKLYDHVCEKHVGRKSTNNLNLTCGWGNCRTTTVKRDHITSHIRVHVPLKPHKCDFCQKAFKRPQDLKKHVKTHAEDPNFQASPEPSRNSHGTATGVFAGQSKHVADLQHLAATASGYYPDHSSMSAAGSVYPSYGTASNPSAYHGPSSHYHQSSYMTTLYPVNASPMSEYEVRKKATYDALNEFFGDVKARQMDPGLYHAVGQRLMTLQSLPNYASANDFGPGPAVSTAAPSAPLTNHYTLPMSNIRTKNDLVHIDQFLEQLQATVYEHETHAAQAAQAGIHQAGSHYMHPGVSVRTSNSPPHISSSRAQGTGHILPPITSTASDTTPALTPASSVMSYNSPGSVHSTTVSPISRGSNASMYPTLPSVSSVSDVSGSAIPSALASSFDPESHRRYSSGLLQRARSADKDSDGLPNISRLGVRSPSLSNVDPALVGDKSKKSPSPTGSDAVDPSLNSSTESKEAGDPDWLTKIRVLEAIRSMVKTRLENHVYEEEDDVDTVRGGSPKQETEDEKEARSLYPILRAVQES